jgi:Tol biopolymer transport system component
MSNQYGPWATSINACGNPQLSSFWRQRMSKLVPTSQTSLTLSRRSLLCLGAAGAMTAVLPTVRIAEALASDVKPTGDDRAASPGRIYIAAVWKVGGNGPDAVQGGIVAVDPKTGGWEKITSGVDAVRVSPDGKSLAFRRFNRPARPAGAPADPTETPIDILAYDLNTGRENPISDDSGDVSWSPDGKQIVVSQRGMGTWRLSRDGSQRVRLPIPDSDAVADWSSDGKWFVTESLRDRPASPDCQIYRMRPDGTSQVRLTKDGRNLRPRFSPDGRRIVYSHDYQPKLDVHELRVMDCDGKNDHAILRNEGLADFRGACWSPDGRWLAVVWTTWEIVSGEKVLRAGEASKFRIEIMGADGRGRRVLDLAGAKVLQFWNPEWR